MKRRSRGSSAPVVLESPEQTTFLLSRNMKRSNGSWNRLFFQIQLPLRKHCKFLRGGPVGSFSGTATSEPVWPLPIKFWLMLALECLPLRISTWNVLMIYCWITKMQEPAKRWKNTCMKMQFRVWRYNTSSSRQNCRNLRRISHRFSGFQTLVSHD